MQMKELIYTPAALLIIIILTACARPGTPSTAPIQTSEPAATSSPTEPSGYPVPSDKIFQPSPVPGYPEPPGQSPTPTPDFAYPAPDLSPTQSISSIEENLLWVSPGTDLYNRVVSIDPLNAERIAYCTKDEIRLSLNSGQTWEGIPTTGAAAVAEEIGYQIFETDSSFSQACLSVTLDPKYPNTFYAVFTAAHTEFGAPPVFYLGFFTTDNGDTWQLVPPPSDSNHISFGGFWSNADRPVEALFSTPTESADPGHSVSIQNTADGGQTWEPGQLDCPITGPCMRWGAAVSNIPGMGSPLPQEIIVSFDAGETWSIIEPPVELRASPPNQLVAFSDQFAEIISGSIILSVSEYEMQPIRSSQDGGQTWQAKPLPPTPGEETDFIYFPGLQILPDGSYISQSTEDQTWFWLSPSDQTWCPLVVNNLPAYPVLLQAVGDELWWVDEETGRAEHTLLADITCAGN
jgi:hypothetical protein